VAQFFQTVAETWNFTAFEPREYIASGDMVAVLGSYTAIARATGRTVSSEWTMVWKIRDGKLAWFREFTDTQALAEAVVARAAA
jgi:ketosteroid isomerase-like protein